MLNLLLILSFSLFMTTHATEGGSNEALYFSLPLEFFEKRNPGESKGSQDKTVQGLLSR